jgi:hypothetical protein
MSERYWYYPAIEMMKLDPSIVEVKRQDGDVKKTLFRIGDDTFAVRTESAAYTWTDIVLTKVTLTRSSGAYNITEEDLEEERRTEEAERLATEVAESALRIKTPPREDDHDHFSTPSPCVRRFSGPPPVERARPVPYLPPPSGPLMRSCCSAETGCTDFECLQSPTLSPPPPPVARHLFFDEEGNVVSKEEYERLRAEEEEPEEEEFGIKIPPIKTPMIARHPRVLLAFFRFIAALNEVAYEGEEVRVPPMSHEVFYNVASYLEHNPPPQEFETEVADLRHFMIQNYLGY